MSEATQANSCVSAYVIDYRDVMNVCVHRLPMNGNTLHDFIIFENRVNILESFELQFIAVLVCGMLVARASHTTGMMCLQCFVDVKHLATASLPDHLGTAKRPFVYGH